MRESTYSLWSKRITAAAVAVFVACDVHAKVITVGIYMEERKADVRELNLVWLDGVYNGLLTASIDLSLDNESELFCPPEKMTMTTDQIRDILDRHIAKYGGKIHMD